jgi:hypothetical protein
MTDIQLTETQWKEELLKYEMQISKDISTIRGWMVFFGIMAVIAMVLSLLGSCLG